MNDSGPKRYIILTRSSGGWWGAQTTINAYNAEEAAEAFIDSQGCCPPNEFAVQSMAASSNGAFKVYRVKPRKAYDLEVI